MPIFRDITGKRLAALRFTPELLAEFFINGEHKFRIENGVPSDAKFEYFFEASELLNSWDFLSRSIFFVYSHPGFNLVPEGAPIEILKPTVEKLNAERT